MPESDLVKTGISGLDSTLSDGIPRGNVILVEGAVGTGKTTMGVEFVYRGASQFGEPGIIVLFEVSPEKLVRDAARFGWDLPALERQRQLKIIFTTRQVFRQELQQADSLLLEQAAEIGARRIFVDGVAGIIGTGTEFEFIREVHSIAGHTNLPVIAISGLTSSGDRQRTEAAGFEGHINKPFDDVALVAALGAVIARRRL
jgi:circadian clock protein KaiC